MTGQKRQLLAIGKGWKDVTCVSGENAPLMLPVEEKKIGTLLSPSSESVKLICGSAPQLLLMVGSSDDGQMAE